jgi:hypothetical protein
MQEAGGFLSLPTHLLMQIVFLLDDSSKLKLRRVSQRTKRIAEMRGSWDGSFKTEEALNIRNIIEGVASRQLSSGKIKSETYLAIVDRISRADQSLIADKRSLSVVADNTRQNLLILSTYTENREIQENKVSHIVSAIWWGLLALMSIFLPPSPAETAYQCVKIEEACQKHINDSLFKLFASRVIAGLAVGLFLKSLDQLLAKKILPAKLSTDLPSLNQLEAERNTKISLNKIAWKVYNARDYIAFSLAIILFGTLSKFQVFIRDINNCENATKGFKQCLASRLNESDKTPEVISFISSLLLAFSMIAILTQAFNCKKISKNLCGFFRNDNLPQHQRLPLLDPNGNNNFLKLE